MKRCAQFVIGTLVLLFLASSARADLIPWGFEWTNTPQVTAGAGKITLSSEAFPRVLGESNIVASNLKVFSSADPLSPDTFSLTGGKYNLSLTLTDINSGATGVMTFSGQMQGTFSQSNANTDNNFDLPNSHTMPIGNSYYQVTLTRFTPPGPPSSGNLGSIGAHVVVTANPRSLPEPSSMILASLGLGLAGVARWRRKFRN